MLPKTRDGFLQLAEARLWPQHPEREWALAAGRNPYHGPEGPEGQPRTGSATTGGMRRHVRLPTPARIVSKSPAATATQPAVGA